VRPLEVPCIDTYLIRLHIGGVRVVRVMALVPALSPLYTNRDQEIEMNTLFMVARRVGMRHNPNEYTNIRDGSASCVSALDT
jgi:hypothetical protein